jgi:hypothetical protein
VRGVVRLTCGEVLPECVALGAHGGDVGLPEVGVFRARGEWGAVDELAGSVAVVAGVDLSSDGVE